MQAIRHGIASCFTQRGSGCSSQRALQCARPSSSKRPVRKPATCVYSIIMPKIAQTSTSKYGERPLAYVLPGTSTPLSAVAVLRGYQEVATQYQTFSRSWVAPLVLAALVTAAVVGVAASAILAIKSNTIWAFRALLVDQNKDPLVTGIALLYGAMAAVISPCVYYLIDTAYKRYQRSLLLQDKTLQEWARAEGLERLFTQEVIQHLDSLGVGVKSARDLAAAAADDHNLLVRVWAVRGSGESKGLTVEIQARAMNQYLVAYHERVIRAMAT